MYQEYVSKERKTITLITYKNQKVQLREMIKEYKSLTTTKLET